MCSRAHPHVFGRACGCAHECLRLGLGKKCLTIQLYFFVIMHMHSTLKAMGVLTILVLCRLYQSYMVLCIFGSLRWRCLHIIMYTMEKGLFHSIPALWYWNRIPAFTLLIKAAVGVMLLLSLRCYTTESFHFLELVIPGSRNSSSWSCGNIEDIRWAISLLFCCRLFKYKWIAHLFPSDLDMVLGPETSSSNPGRHD